MAATHPVLNDCTIARVLQRAPVSYFPYFLLVPAKVIAVNQAWAGSAGARVSAGNTSQVWAKPLGGGCVAVLLLSSTTDTTDVGVALASNTLQGP